MHKKNYPSSNSINNELNNCNRGNQDKNLHNLKKWLKLPLDSAAET